MGPAKCRAEVLVERDGVLSLKPRVADIVERGGGYILCYSRYCEGQHVTERIHKFREAFAEIAGQIKADAVTIDVYGAEKLASWANEHASAIAFVQNCLGRSIPADLQTWSSWEGMHQSLLAYHTNPARNAIMADLRGVLGNQRGVARVAGLSGLGKSRMALELFRPPPDASTKRAEGPERVLRRVPRTER